SFSPDEIISGLTKQYGVYAYAGDVAGSLDRAARALEAVEMNMSAGGYGKKELGEKARGVRGRMEGR
ncbi:MAG: DUF5814 domain-containing protein, partial [Candidatus Methanoperedens sp.]|nr:DUF5814 domain-containing protein [Candidatus Methanoperedens sp.]